MKYLSLTLALLAASPLAAQQPTTVPAALENSRKELQQALNDLTRTRESIATEKPAQSAAFEKIELELAEKRRLTRIARLSTEDREQTLRNLERDRLSRRQDASYLAGILKDHALRSQTLASPGEPELQINPEKLAASPDDSAAALESRLEILDAAVAHLETLIGGSSAPGQAAFPDGSVSSGTFASAGPVSWFLANDGKAGFALPGDRTSTPRVVPAETEAVKSLVAGSTAELGIDVTGGKARALEEVEGGFTDLVRKGGLWVWPIMALGLLSFICGLVKLLSFSRYREPGEAWVTAILAALRTGDRKAALHLAQDAKHPASPVMGKLIEVAGNDADLVEETLYEQLMGVQQHSSSLLSIIAVTAASSPLLGLLGTVSGMISTFNLITIFGSGDPKPLAGGISEALITTLFGLVVAIPALILHAFLTRRSQGIVQTTERLGLSFVNALRSK